MRDFAVVNDPSAALALLLEESEHGPFIHVRVELSANAIKPRVDAAVGGGTAVEKFSEERWQITHLRVIGRSPTLR
jgi:hypothetical protein